MPRSATKSSSKSVKVPTGVRTKLAAALQTNWPQLSKQLKRKADQDDRLRAVLEKILKDSDDYDDNDNDEYRNEDIDDDVIYHKPSWIDNWIKQPPGERGRRTVPDEREGWGKPEIIEATGITEAQYTHYMKSAHRLCNRYFDVSLPFTENEILYPAEYSLIVEKMKELHPRFRFHTKDWLTRHFVLSHCAAMSRSIARLGTDPDIEIYNNYINHQKMNRTTRVLRKHRIKQSNQSVLPRPTARQIPKKKKSAAREESLYTHMPQEAASEDAEMGSYEPAAATALTLREPSREPEPEAPAPATPRKARNYMDLDSDVDFEANTNTDVALKKADKGKGKVIDPPEAFYQGPALRGSSTRTRRKVVNPRLNQTDCT